MVEQKGSLYYKTEYFRQKLINESLLKCISTLYETSETEQTSNNLLKIISDFYSCDRAFIFELDETGDYMNNTYELCSNDYPQRIEEFQNIPVKFMEEWVKDLVNLDQFIVEKNKLTEKDYENPAIQLIVAETVENIVAVPLKINGVFLGFIGLTNYRKNKDNLVLLKSVATFLLNDLQRKKFTQQLIDMSFYDRLTGLHNRHAYISTMQALEGKPVPLGIIFADLNGLKAANDNLGHVEGDKMITECANELSNEFPDCVYRIGGDEFVVFCEGIPEQIFNEKIQHMKENWKSQYSCSFGTIWLPLCESIEYYMHIADDRMYEDKEKYYETHKRHR